MKVETGQGAFFLLDHFLHSLNAPAQPPCRKAIVPLHCKIGGKLPAALPEIV
jgi:hypothetical protein